MLDGGPAAMAAFRGLGIRDTGPAAGLNAVLMGSSPVLRARSPQVSVGALGVRQQTGPVISLRTQAPCQPCRLPIQASRRILQSHCRKPRRVARAEALPQGVEEKHLQSAATYEDQATEDLVLSCTTFNVLAPIYKRLGGREDVRESHFPSQWRPRNERIIRELMAKKSSIVCLQELWLSNPELVALYNKALDAEGYETYTLPRPNNRGDGLLTAVRTDRLEVVHQEDLHFNDCGDRVAQFLWLRSRPGCCQVNKDDGVPDASATKGGGAATEPCQEMIVVNTHLLFPHNAASSTIRLRQVYKALEHLESYKARHNLGPVPVVLCGDLNGTKRGQVYNFLRSQGFVSSYDIAHNQPDSDQRWISHRNHHGKVCGVDFIWLLNPSEQRSALALDWKAAVWSQLTARLAERGCSSDLEAFNFFCGPAEDEIDTEHGKHSRSPLQGTLREVPWNSAQGAKAITQSSMKSAVEEIGGELSLTKEEIDEMLASADANGNGVICFDEFQSVLERSQSAASLPSKGPCTVGDASCQQQQRAADDGYESEAAEVYSESEGTCGGGGGGQEEVGLLPGFAVAEASLYPPETASGIWPHHYTLSDHALLTAVFAPADLVRHV